jgi:hypothetical protein
MYKPGANLEKDATTQEGYFFLSSRKNSLPNYCVAEHYRWFHLVGIGFV